METKRITVGALKEYLKDVPDNYTIIISKDGEGNSFSPMVGEISFVRYEPENAFLGDFEFDDEKPSSIVLFPVS
ncbi:MAG: hypothetical protein HY842_15235 [Bacteroidetes bacterium]|nr:hypothetical protein [Bacteroidota bacterium]